MRRLALAFVFMAGLACPLVARAAAGVRLAGELPFPPDELVARRPGQTLSGEYRICLDDAGTVTKLEAQKPMPEMNDAVMTALGGWRWFMFTLEGKADAPPCFDYKVKLPIGRPSRVTRVADARAFHQERHVGTTPVLPYFYRVRHAGQTVRGIYKVCVDDGSGVMRSLKPIASLDDRADEAVMAALRTWSWDITASTTRPSPICFVEAIEVAVTTPDKRDDNDDTGTVLRPFAPDGKLPGDRSLIVRVNNESRPDPHLPDGVKRALLEDGHFSDARVTTALEVCVDATGKVASASVLPPSFPDAGEAVARVIYTWRYRVAGTPGVGACLLGRWVFDIRRNQPR